MDPKKSLQAAGIDELLGALQRLMMFRAFMQCVCEILLRRIQDPVECVKHGVSKVASSPDYQPCGLDQHGSSIVNLRDRRALIGTLSLHSWE